jgi:hypothetical protein
MRVFGLIISFSFLIVVLVALGNACSQSPAPSNLGQQGSQPNSYAATGLLPNLYPTQAQISEAQIVAGQSLQLAQGAQNQVVIQGISTSNPSRLIGDQFLTSAMNAQQSCVNSANKMLCSNTQITSPAIKAKLNYDSAIIQSQPQRVGNPSPADPQAGDPSCNSSSYLAAVSSAQAAELAASSAFQSVFTATASYEGGQMIVSNLIDCINKCSAGAQTAVSRSMSIITSDSKALMMSATSNFITGASLNYNQSNMLHGTLLNITAKCDSKISSLQSIALGLQSAADQLNIGVGLYQNLNWNKMLNSACYGWDSTSSIANCK